jgi:hypothetical protein
MYQASWNPQSVSPSCTKEKSRKTRGAYANHGVDGENDQRGRSHQQRGAQELFDNDVEVGRMGQEEHDEVGEEEPVFVVLRPQSREGRVRDEADIAPLVVEDDIAGVAMDQPEVRDDRDQHQRGGENSHEAPWSKG